jgi:hypothetical protein
MNLARWIEDCCALAIFDSNKMGIEAATYKQTVAGWKILLTRANNEHFPLPNPRIHKEKNLLLERCPIASCLDFAEEMTALQHVRNELGVSVIITPKFHTELAGEGIEYSWGISKGVYHRKPLHSKRARIQDVSKGMHKQRDSWNKDSEQAFKVGKSIHLCILRTL